MLANTFIYGFGGHPAHLGRLWTVATLVYWFQILVETILLIAYQCELALSLVITRCSKGRDVG